MHDTHSNVNPVQPTPLPDSEWRIHTIERTLCQLHIHRISADDDQRAQMVSAWTTVWEDSLCHFTLPYLTYHNPTINAICKTANVHDTHSNVNPVQPALLPDSEWRIHTIERTVSESHIHRIWADDDQRAQMGSAWTTVWEDSLCHCTLPYLTYHNQRNLQHSKRA